jgi:hypothetical protein
MNTKHIVRHIILLLLLVFPWPVLAQDPSPAPDVSRSKIELLKKINRRVSEITTLPFKSSLLYGDGYDHTFGYNLNLEPVIPFSMGSDHMFLTRIDLPIVYKERPPDGTSLALSDTQVSFVFAPNKPRDGWMWGFGQLWLIPTATRNDLGASKWGAGLTGTLVHETDNWTVGARLDHIWSFAGPGTGSINDAYLDPWITRSWENGVSVKLESESHYKWNTEELSVPVELGASKLIMAGTQPLNIGADVLYWARRSPNDPQWGFRFTLNLVFPK